MAQRKFSFSKDRPPAGLPTESSTNSFWHSEPSPLLIAHRTTRDLPKCADVVVIGSGMTGTSVAYHLLSNDIRSSLTVHDKLDVVMLEAREACWGATGRNGGHCQPVLFEHPHDPSIAHFELNNFHTLQKLITDKKIDCEFVAQPAVRAIYDSRHLTDVELAMYTLKDSAPELAKHMRLVMKREDLAELRIRTAIGAVVTDTAARMWPYKFVSHILRELLTSPDIHGTFNLQTLTPATSVTQNADDSYTVSTPRGAITAKKVVLATNAYTSHLLPSFADLIVPVRGQMSSLLPLESVAGDSRLKMSMGFMGVAIDDYLIQRPNERGGHLMFGGGRQHGVSVGVTDDSTIDEKTAEYLRRRLVDALTLPEGKKDKGEDAMPGKCDQCKATTETKTRCSRRTALHPCRRCIIFGQACMTTPTLIQSNKPTEFTATHEWTGIMGFSRDELPWVGPLPSQKNPCRDSNLYLAAGYTGHGMPNTWLCGKAVGLMVQRTLAISRISTVPCLEASPGELARAEVVREEAKILAVERVVKEVGLPHSYLVSEARMTSARELEDVGAKDWAEMERAKRREGVDRPHSGYA